MADPQLPCAWGDDDHASPAVKRVHDQGDTGRASSWACAEHLDEARQWVRTLTDAEPVETDLPTRDLIGRVNW